MSASALSPPSRSASALCSNQWRCRRHSRACSRRWRSSGAPCRPSCGWWRAETCRARIIRSPRQGARGKVCTTRTFRRLGELAPNQTKELWSAAKRKIGKSAANPRSRASTGSRHERRACAIPLSMRIGRHRSKRPGTRQTQSLCWPMHPPQQRANGTLANRNYET